MEQKTVRLISLHPKLAAGLDIVAAFIFLWLIKIIPHGWYWALGWASARVLWWVLLSQFMYFPSYAKRLPHWLSLLFFQMGIAGYFLFLEPGSAYLLASLLFICVPFISFWLVPEHEQSLPVVAKSYRRWRLMQSAVGVTGLWTTVFAIDTYQFIGQTLHLLFLVGGAVLVTSFISSWWWYEYDNNVHARFWVASALMCAIAAELAYVFLLLPWGYLVAGFVFGWIWYIIWILMRYHLSSEGIRWQRQRWFVFLNVVLIALFLIFIVRWH